MTVAAQTPQPTAPNTPDSDPPFIESEPSEDTTIATADEEISDDDGPETCEIDDEFDDDDVDCDEFSWDDVNELYTELVDVLRTEGLAERMSFASFASFVNRTSDKSAGALQLSVAHDSDGAPFFFLSGAGDDE